MKTDFMSVPEGPSIPKPVSSTARALPSNYRTILDVIEEAAPGVHLTAQEIWLRARTLQPRIGFATVHRGLIRLHELGALMKVDVSGETSAVYEPAESPHAHFRCTACGAIADIEYAVPAHTIRRLAQRHGVAIDGEAVTFTGRCASCS